MKPAIDQMIAWLEGEMAKYATPAGYMDKGYRVLDTAKRQALKIKERCDADALQKLISGIQVSSGGIQVVEMSASDDEAFHAATNAAWLGTARAVCEVDNADAVDMPAGWMPVGIKINPS